MTQEDGRHTIPPGSQVEFANSVKEAKQILLEGLAGVMVTNGILKINCFEQFFEVDRPGLVLGKYNYVLNIPVSQFLQIEDVLHGIAEELKAGVPAAEVKAPE